MLAKPWVHKYAYASDTLQIRLICKSATLRPRNQLSQYPIRKNRVLACRTELRKLALPWSGERAEILIRRIGTECKSGAVRGFAETADMLFAGGGGLSPTPGE
ncbi:UNVERIFIED_ORG: hypothetical protein GGI57_006089 [Rhizobium aethiopicum]